MGYDLHITRKGHWADEEGKLITEDEWREVIKSEPELALDSETICADTVFASWNGQAGSLAYSNGEIVAKNPDKALTRMMIIIAAKLRANVQGDDGELYLPTGEAVSEHKQVVVRYPWWLLGLCLFTIGCFIVVLLQILTGG